jgi:hypothetical protein
MVEKQARFARLVAEFIQKAYDVKDAPGEEDSKTKTIITIL